VKALQVSTKNSGHTLQLVSIYSDTDLSCDAAIILGTRSKPIFDRLHWRGIPYIFIDVGYSHRAFYWRHAINDTQPLSWLMLHQAKPPDRRLALGWSLKEWRGSSPDRHALFVGSGASHYQSAGINDPARWEYEIVQSLRRVSRRPIVYRPKGRKAAPIPGVGVSPFTSIEFDLADAHAVVTHGSSASIDAVRAGVPCIVLGNAPAKPISSLSLSQIEAPRMVSMGEREQWLNNLAYTQFSLDEYVSGEAWSNIENQLDLVTHGRRTQKKA